MALFRTTHNDDLIQNWFWELPDHYWIGTMLVNKHTMMPVSGYDTPLAQFAPIPPRPLWWGYDSGTFGTNDFFSDSRGASQGPVEYYSTFWSNTYNYGLCNRPFATGMALGQCGFMGLGMFPVRYIADSNNPDEFPSGYVRDPDDEDIVYTQLVGGSVGEAGYLVKYNTKTHKVLWSSRNFGSLAFARMQIFAIEGNYLFILGNVANPVGHGKQVFDHPKYGTSGESIVHQYTNQDVTPYHIKSGWYIAKVHKETGAFDNILDVFNPNFHFGDGGSCQYLGQVEDGQDLFLLFTTNSNANFKIIAQAKTLKYDYYYRGSYNSLRLQNGVHYFQITTSATSANSTTGSAKLNDNTHRNTQITWSKSTYPNAAHDYYADFMGFVTVQADGTTVSNTISATMTQSLKFIKYDRTTHSISVVPGDTLSTVSKWADSGNHTYNCVSLQGNPTYNFTSRPSRPDKTITGAIVCYGHWGKLLAVNALSSEAVATDVRAIWKHIYQGGNQSHEPMTVLNKTGQLMTLADWEDASINGHSAKFYVLYGENKKFLMVHDSYLFGGGGSPQDNSDVYAKTYVFEFVNPSTLRLVSDVNLNCTDLLWIKHNWFVAARRNRIRIYSIDLETGEIKIERSVTTKTGDNYFSYVYVDDMRNLWFSEVGKDLFQPTQLSSSLYFINSYTISKLSMEPEKFLYTYSGSSIETYVKIAAIGDFSELIERTVKLTAVGPMVFKDNNAKTITVKTSAGTYKTLEVVLTGVGEISVTMTLA